MKKLLTTNSQIDADLIMGILEEEKIVADLRYVGSGSYLNIVGGDMGYAKEVWVADSDYERAISVLKETDFLENKQNEKTTEKELTSKVVVARILAAIMIFAVFISIIISFT